MAVSNLHINIRPSHIYDTLKNMSYTAGSYFSQGTQAEQNYLHEYGVTLKRDDSVFQSLFSDNTNYKAAHQMNNWDADVYSFANFDVNKAHADYSKASFNAIDTNGNSMGTYSLSSLTNAQVDSLISVGTCNLTSGGSINIDATERSRISALRNNVRTAEHNVHLTHGTTSEQMEVYKELQTTIKQQYDLAYNNLSKSAKDAIDKAFQLKNPQVYKNAWANGKDYKFDLAKEIKKEKTRLDWIDEALKNNSLDSAVKQELLDLRKVTNARCQTNISGVSSRVTAKQRYGFSSMARASLGSDFYTGIAFYKGVSNIGSRMGHLISRSMPAQGLRSLVTGESLKDIKAFDKQLMDARKSGSKREIRNLKRDRKRNIKDKRMNRRISKKELALQRNPASAKLQKRLEKLRHKNERRMTRRSRADAIRKRFNEALGNLKKRLNKTIVARFFRGISKVFNVFAGLKKKLIIGGAGLLLVFLISIFVLIPISLLLIHFLTEPTDLMGSLDNLNYGQYTVDMINKNMSKPLLDTIKNDAQWHYNFDYIKGLVDEDFRHPSTKVDWNKSMTVAEIGRIRNEYGEEITSINDNIVPILSMAKIRYRDLWDFQNHVTPMAYCYNLYANTHDITGYTYTDMDDCPNTELYMGDRFYSASTGKVYYGIKGELMTNTGLEYLPEDAKINGDFLCENVYFHGYQGFLVKNSTISNLWSNAVSTGVSIINWVRNAVGIEEVVTVGKESGLWVGEIPNDSKGTCNHYKACKYNSISICGKEEHVHTDTCYTEWDEVKREILYNGPTDGKSANAYRALGGFYDQQTKQWVLETTTHHKELTCGKEEHTHRPWKSESDPGCYQTAYLCLGHCGGHLICEADVEVVCDVNNITQKDWMSLPASFTGETDFLTIFQNGLPTVGVWKTYWNIKTAAMFTPLPLSPAGAIESLGRHLVYFGTAIVDSFTGLTNDAISALTGNSKSASDSAALKAVNNYYQHTVGNVIEDVFNFEGWDVALDEFEGFYGTYDELDEDDKPYPYYSAILRWDEIGEVRFPIGGGRPFRESQIESIIASIKTAHTLSKEQEKLVEEALRSVGQYFYVETTEAQTNGATNNKGRTNGSGFACGIYNRVKGTNMNLSYSDLARSSITSEEMFAPGKILVKNTNDFQGGKWGYNKKANQVAISLGTGYKMNLEGYTLTGKGTNKLYVIVIDDYGATIKATKKTDWQYGY